MQNPEEEQQTVLSFLHDMTTNWEIVYMVSLYAVIISINQHIFYQDLHYFP